MADEYVCDTPEVRSFIGEVKQIIHCTASLQERLTAIRPIFSRMMADPDWLPEAFRRTHEAGGMGQGIANWLLYRDTEGTLSLSALVLPPGVATPVHDHLAWGLVGLYVGEQQEEVYEAETEVGPEDQFASLKLAVVNSLTAGSFYELVPPSGDIHRVITTGEKASISLHLLANDVGCVLRHRYQPDTGQVAPFRSGYSNKVCETQEAPLSEKA